MIPGFRFPSGGRIDLEFISEAFVWFVHLLISCIACSFPGSFVYSSAWLLVCSLIYSRVHTVACLLVSQAVSSFTGPFTYSYSHSFARSFARSNSFLESFIHLLGGQLRAKQTTITLLPHHTTLRVSPLLRNRNFIVLGSRTLLSSGRIYSGDRIEAGHLMRQCRYKVTNFNSASIVSSRKTASIVRRPGI